MVEAGLTRLAAALTSAEKAFEELATEPERIAGARLEAARARVRRECASALEEASLALRAALAAGDAVFAEAAEPEETKPEETKP